MRSRDGREKASDVLRKSVPFFGRKPTSLEEAFPEIDDITIEVHEHALGSSGSGRTFRYNKASLPDEVVDCSNPVCYGGGVNTSKLTTPRSSPLSRASLPATCTQG